MKRLLLPLLAALALPTAVDANEAYLVLTNGIYATVWSRKAQSDSTNTIALPMKTMAGCIEEGKKWAESPIRYKNDDKAFRDYQCIRYK